MKRLLAIEWSKIYYFKATRIFTLLYFVLLILLGVALAFVKPEIGGIELDIVQLGFFKYPTIWQNITYLVSIGKIFLAIIIILNITNEFSNRTIKQNLIDGLSKNEFIFAKMMINLLLAVASTVFVFVITLVLGAVFAGEDVSVYQGMEYMTAYFIKIAFFFSFCFFLAVLLRKSALALLGLFVWWVIEGVIGIVEFVLMDKSKGIEPDGFFFTNLLPLGSSSKLIDFPTIEITGFISGESIFKYSAVEWMYASVSIGYAVLFIFLSYWILKKRDL